MLGGVKSLTVHDDSIVQWADLSSQFYLQESDVGKKSRSAASKEKLAELNSYVPVSSLEGELTEAALARFQVFTPFLFPISQSGDSFSVPKKKKVVVLTDSSLAEQIRINHITREKGIAFISTQVRGVFGFAAFSPFFFSFAKQQIK